MKLIASASRFHLLSAPSKASRKSAKGFSLVELLTVLAVISLLAATVAPAITSIGNAENVTSGSDAISASLQRARTYAMTHNTYVWVGFYEEAANSLTPTKVAPPYTGKGRVVIGMAASVDGTASAAGGTGLPTLTPIEKLTILPNIHLTDIGAPATPGSTTATSSIDSRPAGAFDSTGELQYGISSDTSDVATNPITVGNYTFYKTVRFSPSGEAIVNDVTDLRRVNEIGIRPTHGAALDSTSPNIVAVQFTGIGGNVQIYRK